MNGDIDATETLRQQFQQLQEQHQKKLLLRKQKLSGTTTVQKPEVNGGESVHINTPSSVSGLLGSEIEDNLELELDNDFTEDFPIQQNSELGNVTRELKDENGRLYKLLAERDEEMRILRKQVNQERQAMVGSGLASDTAANRIIELSKKNRELASDIEKERRKLKQLSKKLEELQRNSSSTEAQDIFTKNTRNRKTDEKGFVDEEQVSSQILQEKLKQALAKMAEHRNQCEILKKEARLAQKVIAKECGEGVNIAAILNEPSGWRGRQQQIATLQNKVNELRQQLSEASRSKLAQSSNAFPHPGLSLQRASTPSFHDEKHKQMLRKMEKNKKEAYENVSGELQLLTEEHNKLQTKFDAAKTRNKILASELKGIKTQTKMLVDKGSHDDELIAALMREQERLRKTLEKKSSQISDRTQSRHETAQQDSELVLTLTRLCKEREEKVAKLEQELQTMVSDVSQASPQPQSVSTEFVDKATLTDHITVTENSNVSSSSIDYPQNVEDGTRNPTTYNFNVDSSPRRRRIVRSAGKNSGASTLPPTPPRSGSGRRKTSGVSSEGRQQPGNQFEEYRPLYEATKVERDKLVELVSMQQEREKQAQQSVYKMSNDVKNLQRQNVELEKKLARVLAGQNPRSHQEKTRKQQNARRQRERTGEEAVDESYHMGELETQLAIQKDENDALKEALDATLQGKKEDFFFYQDIVEQTKQVFVQGLHHYRQTSAPT